MTPTSIAPGRLERIAAGLGPIECVVLTATGRRDCTIEDVAARLGREAGEQAGPVLGRLCRSGLVKTVGPARWAITPRGEAVLALCRHEFDAYRPDAETVRRVSAGLRAVANPSGLYRQAAGCPPSDSSERTKQ
jgi:hypothetical protein